LNSRRGDEGQESSPAFVGSAAQMFGNWRC
jgi:hypothetical protein